RFSWNSDRGLVSPHLRQRFISTLRSRTPCRGRGRGGCGRRGRGGRRGRSSFLLRALPAHQPPTGADVDVVVLAAVRACRLQCSLLSWVLRGWLQRGRRQRPRCCLSCGRPSTATAEPPSDRQLPPQRSPV